jgi:hypothetical protein
VEDSRGVRKGMKGCRGVWRGMEGLEGDGGYAASWKFIAHY